MSLPLTGVVVSALGALLLSLLFRHESRIGYRYLTSLREWCDVRVEKVSLWSVRVVRYLGRDMPRQSVHYLFHGLLVSVLRFIKRLEVWLQTVLRSNRKLAERARTEVRTKNIFDEIAEHKASIALSEAEKKRRRRKLLEE